MQQYPGMVCSVFNQSQSKCGAVMIHCPLSLLSCVVLDIIWISTVVEYEYLHYLNITQLMVSNVLGRQEIPLLNVGQCTFVNCKSIPGDNLMIIMPIVCTAVQLCQSDRTQVTVVAILINLVQLFVFVYHSVPYTFHLLFHSFDVFHVRRCKKYSK